MVPTTKAKQRVWVKAMIAEAGSAQPRVFLVQRMLEILLGQLSNRTPRPRGRNTSVPLTPEVEDQIRTACHEDPEKPYQDIANALGTNIGRISEVNVGKRT